MASTQDRRPSIALVVTPFSDQNFQLAAQLGVEDIIYYDMDTMPLTVEGLQHIQAKVAKWGLRLAVIESGPPIDKVITGEDGRDEQIAVFQQCLRNMGQVGIPTLCYTFMNYNLRVARTSFELPIRGGALTSEFRWSDWDDSLRTPGGETSAEEMWANAEYFIKRVGPVADEAGVNLALHPDDPPIPRLRGLARIMTSTDNLERYLSLYPSSRHGLTFCQGTIGEMGVDMEKEIRRFEGRVHFVHFRDVLGVSPNFLEVFQDQGKTDMLGALRTWKEIGYSGPMRPDHVPLLVGEEGHPVGDKAKGYHISGRASGYTMMGRLFAVGYMRGLFEAVWGKKDVYSNSKATVAKK